MISQERERVALFFVSWGGKDTVDKELKETGIRVVRMIGKGGGEGENTVERRQQTRKKEKSEVKRSVGCIKVLINKSATRSRSCDIIISCLLCVDSL